MKKEDIYIEVTPETIGAYVEVLERHGEAIGSVEAGSKTFKYLKCSPISGGWFTSRHNIGRSRVHWTPQDLEEFLNPDPFKVCIKVTADTIEKFQECLNKLGYPMFALSGSGYLMCTGEIWATVWEPEGRRVVEWTPDELHSNILIKRHERTQMTDSVLHNNVVIKSEHEYVVKNADGTASSVTLRDDKAVVEMPNGTLRIVDKSNLFKIV